MGYGRDEENMRGVDGDAFVGDAFVGDAFVGDAFVGDAFVGETELESKMAKEGWIRNYLKGHPASSRKDAETIWTQKSEVEGDAFVGLSFGDIIRAPLKVTERVLTGTYYGTKGALKGTYQGVRYGTDAPDKRSAAQKRADALRSKRLAAAKRRQAAIARQRAATAQRTEEQSAAAAEAEASKAEAAASEAEASDNAADATESPDAGDDTAGDAFVGAFMGDAFVGNDIGAAIDKLHPAARKHIGTAAKLAATNSPAGLQVRAGMTLYKAAKKGHPQAQKAVNGIATQAATGHPQAKRDMAALHLGRKATHEMKTARKAHVMALRHEARRKRAISRRKHFELLTLFKPKPPVGKRQLGAALVMRGRAVKGDKKARRQVRMIQAAARAGNPTAKRITRDLQLAKAIQQTTKTRAGKRQFKASLALYREARKPGRRGEAARGKIKLVNDASLAGDKNALAAIHTLKLAIAAELVVKGRTTRSHRVPKKKGFELLSFRRGSKVVGRRGHPGVERIAFKKGEKVIGRRPPSRLERMAALRRKKAIHIAALHKRRAVPRKGKLVLAALPPAAAAVILAAKKDPVARKKLDVAVKTVEASKAGNPTARAQIAEAQKHPDTAATVTAAAAIVEAKAPTVSEAVTLTPPEFRKEDISPAPGKIALAALPPAAIAVLAAAKKDPAAKAQLAAAVETVEASRAGDQGARQAVQIAMRDPDKAATLSAAAAIVAAKETKAESVEASRGPSFPPAAAAAALAAVPGAVALNQAFQSGDPAAKKAVVEAAKVYKAAEAGNPAAKKIIVAAQKDSSEGHAPAKKAMAAMAVAVVALKTEGAKRPAERGLAQAMPTAEALQRMDTGEFGHWYTGPFSTYRNAVRMGAW